MLNVDINLFDFDWDLTWAGFFMNAQGHIYARYGIRNSANGESTMSIPGLTKVMREVLEIHKKEAGKRPKRRMRRVRIQDLTSYKKDARAPRGCAHCHHAYTYKRKELMNIGRWRKEQLYVYPLSDNLGISLDLDENTLVTGVTGLAAKAGVQSGDRILSMNKQRVLSPADIASVLHYFKSGTLKMEVERSGEEKPKAISMRLSGKKWRERDLSWRESVNVLSPQAGFNAPPLAAGMKSQMGLDPGALALEVRFVAPNSPAKRAGLKMKDVIIAVDGRTTSMTQNELTQHIWMNHDPGSVLRLVVVRKKRQRPIFVRLQ